MMVNNELGRIWNEVDLDYFKMMMISGATAQTGPWPPFTGFMIVFIVRFGVISSTIDLF
jgi:hypothetical protein